MPPTLTVPVKNLVRPRLRPCSIRKVPSVMMKLGSPVRVTTHPLRKPMARASTSAAPMATQMFSPNSVETTPTVSAVVPVITPAERSKWPPIISIATATAMMPSVEAGSSQFATPRTERNTGDCTAKNTKITTAPMSAPSSGLTSSRRNGPTAASRSSGGGARGGGAARRPARCPARPAPCGCSAGPLLGQVGDLVDVVLVDDARPGQHRLAAADGFQVLLVELEHHDRQVALLVLLLVDGEGDRAVLDALDDVLVQVEGGHLGL